jgi:3-hydroxyisobutyrate dehydrogenase
LGYDLDRAAMARAADAGSHPAASIAEAVREADAVITMLPAGRHVRQVFEEEVLPSARKGAVLIDCSTIDVETARAVSALAREAGFPFADAPVSGGVVGAEAGTLSFMVGCEAQALPAVQEALQPMAKAVIYAGGPGAGQAAKICNNMLLGISMLGACEAFALAEKLGLDWSRFFEIASKSSGQCWSLTTNCPIPGPVPTSPANRDYAPGFTAALMLKDLKLAQAAAAASGASTPMGAEAEALYALFDGLGHGGRDFSAVIQMLRGRLEELG